MKLELLTSQVKSDIEAWSLSQAQVKPWRLDLRLDSSSSLLACQGLELDSSSSSSRDLRLASRVKPTHPSLKLDLTASLDLVEFSRYKSSKIRRNLAAIPIRPNLTTFYFDFFRRFQNWFHIFDTSHIRRETASVPMNSRDFVEIFEKSAWNFFIKSAASPIGS